MTPDDVRVPVAEGVRLRVRRWPGRDRTPFLLVHGLSSNARLWDGVARRLAEAGHPAYAVDLRSHGESDAPDTGYDTATAAADLADLASGLGLSTVVAVGQSWGGNVVVRLAAERPELVSALGLVDGGWIDLPAQFDSWERCAAALRPPDIDGVRLTGVVARLRRSHPDWPEWAIEATAANLRTDPDGLVSRRLSIPHHMEIVRSMWDDPPAPYLPKVEAPALLLPAGRPAAANRAAAALPLATVKEYAGADHDLHAQHPDEVAADLLTLVS